MIKKVAPFEQRFKNFLSQHSVEQGPFEKPITHILRSFDQKSYYGSALFQGWELKGNRVVYRVYLDDGTVYEGSALFEKKWYSRDFFYLVEVWGRYETTQLRGA